MKARKWMLGTAAIAMVAGTSLIGSPQGVFISTAAAAKDVSVNVNFNLFYDRLDPYGDWVSYQSAYVWVPRAINVEWRPYTRGHWTYTRQYGWLWVSDEPFGWATYHYGRWGHAEDIGWYWVPARRWAPAWVAWRRSDNYLAWAPLPPDDGVSISFEINFDVDRVPRNYWVAVESDRFLDRDISRVAVYDERIIEQAQPVGTVVVQNNTVINNAIEVKYIEQKTKKPVEVREAKSVDNPESTGKAEGDAVGVFNADLQGDEKAMKPKKTRQAREVIEERKKLPVIQPEDTTGTVTAPVQEPQRPAIPRKKKKPEDETRKLKPPEIQKQEPRTERKKKLLPEETVTEPTPDKPTGSVTPKKPEGKPQVQEPRQDGKPANKRKKKCDPEQEECP